MTIENNADATFHPGERMLQERHGWLDKNLRLAARMLSDEMPMQHMLFYAQLPWLCVAWVDRDGWPRLSLVNGQPGFARALSPNVLAIAIENDAALREGLREGVTVGVLGIELHTRRRNRLHGRAEWDGDTLQIHIKQAYGNCPKYIHARSLTPIDNAPLAHAPLPAIDERARTLIESAETLFIASAYLGREEADSSGADASHRGGRSGFVEVPQPHQLRFVDYPGNRLFNTVGNLLLNPACTLNFIDFNNGHLVEIRGKATIHFEHPLLEGVRKGERLVEVEVHHCRHIDYGFPFQGDVGEASKNSLNAGLLSERDNA